MSKTAKINIFIAYARANQQYQKVLYRQLRVLEKSKVVNRIWYDGEIIAGQQWDAEIKKNLAASQIIFFLISAEFMASDYIMEEEYPKSLQRQADGKATIVPIIVDHCYWEVIPDIHQLQIPNPNEPLSDTPNLSLLLKKIVKKVHQAVQLRAKTEEVSKTILQQSKTEVITPPISQEEEKPLPFEPEMVFVKGGQFWMGYKEGRDGEDEFLDTSKPLTRVSVKDFHIGKYPITNEEYCVFLNDYGSEKVKPGEHQKQLMIEEHQWGVHLAGRWKPQKGYERHPVIMTSWYGANEYCNWLSKTTRKSYHLPSEAQWEYAARGGWESEGFKYAGSNNIDEVAWRGKNAKSSTYKVGTTPKANELGICDMSCNVWEWCQDIWHENYEGLPKDGSAWIQGDDISFRVLRGGSWLNYCRVAYRSRSCTYFGINVIGFRVVRY
ncbi:MAG: SUMF1/EgtB/PvdO family nonheme iron enzyme [Bacteroidota bacterium]